MLQQKQKLPSSARNVIHVMMAYDTYMVDMKLDIDQSLLETADAILSQNEKEKAEQKRDEATCGAAHAHESVQDVETLDKLQDLILRAFNTYNKNRLVRNAEIDPEV